MANQQRTMVLQFGNGTQVARIECETDKIFVVTRYNSSREEWYTATSKVSKSDARIVEIDGVEYVPTAKKVVKKAVVKGSTFSARIVKALTKGYFVWNRTSANMGQIAFSLDQIENFMVVKDGLIVLSTSFVEVLGDWMAANSTALRCIQVYPKGHFSNESAQPVSYDLELHNTGTKEDILIVLRK